MLAHKAPRTIVHLHVHGEDSTLDGLPQVKEIIERAKEIKSPAVALTDHGVMAGIPDFITACEKEGIKPIPGVEAYMALDRTMKGPEFEKWREEICKKYKITDNKGKVKRKAFNDFLRKVRRDMSVFEEEAKKILVDYLMEGSMDLFDLLEFNKEETPEEKIEKFKKDITEYLDYTGNFHLLLIAVNNQGLKDLYKITSDAHINGFYSDPRTDLNYIKENNLGKNIIATSACLGGYFAHLVMKDRIEEAKAFIEECKEIFHSFYLEKQAVLSREQIYLNEIIDHLAEETGIPKIITTDAHFARKEDHKIHDILVAGSMNKCVQDEDRYQYAEDHYLKSVEEIKENFNDDEAIWNTLKIAEKINVTLPKEPLLPKFPVEDGDKPEEILKKKTWNNLFQYCLNNPDIDFNEYANRLNYELEIICDKGFADYFLITEDFINAAKNEGYLIGPGRGSAAGSLVSFMLNITTLDPIKYDLLFERFMNPERPGYPDIDVDFPYDGAAWTQEYLKKTYGEDKVAQIGTKGTLAARAAIRFVGKALGYSSKGNYQLEDAFAKAIPGKPGIKLKEAYKQEGLVRNYAEQYPEWWEAALKLEGHVRSYGVHAAGIVISPKPLTETVPLRLDEKGQVTTQYDMDWIEKLLVKFDILKLDTLDLIQLAMEYAGIKDKVDIDQIDLNDPNIYNRVYKKLRLNGIFQVEGEGMRDVMEKLQPETFENIAAINALYRPGPMDNIPTYIRRKNGLEPVRYPFPELEPILKKTYGLFVYQEQLMQASQVLGGLTLGQADMIRKGVAKQQHDVMNRWLDLMIYGSESYIQRHKQLIEQYPNKNDIPLDDKGKPSIWVDYDLDEIPYVEGAIHRGFDEGKLLKLKKDWISFGSYAFNASHAFAYAKLSVMTAYLKAYYPAAFMAALLTISEGKKDKNGQPKSIAYMRECEEMGIEILPPDLNESQAGWTVITKEDGKQAIRYGLESIASISGETINELITHQPYTSLQDLIKRTDSRKVNKTKIINLIKAGAFDSINSNRNQLLREYMEHRGEEFSHIPERTNKTHVIQYEREVLGTSVSIKSRWNKLPDQKKNIQFTGQFTEIAPFTSKKGQEHCRVTLLTSEDEIKGLIFNRQWMRLKDKLIIGQKVIVKGNKNGDTLLINSVRFK